MASDAQSQYLEQLTEWVKQYSHLATENLDAAKEKLVEITGAHSGLSSFVKKMAEKGWFVLILRDSTLEAAPGVNSYIIFSQDGKKKLEFTEEKAFTVLEIYSNKDNFAEVKKTVSDDQWENLETELFHPLVKSEPEGIYFVTNESDKIPATPDLENFIFKNAPKVSDNLVAQPQQAQPEATPVPTPEPQLKPKTEPVEEEQPKASLPVQAEPQSPKQEEPRSSTPPVIAKVKEEPQDIPPPAPAPRSGELGSREFPIEIYDGTDTLFNHPIRVLYAERIPRTIPKIKLYGSSAEGTIVLSASDFMSAEDLAKDRQCLFGECNPTKDRATGFIMRDDIERIVNKKPEEPKPTTTPEQVTSDFTSVGCEKHTTSRLREIASQLKIKWSENDSREKLCSMIKSELHRRRIEKWGP